MRHYLQTLVLKQETDLAIVGDFVHIYSSTGEVLVDVGDDIVVLETGSTYRATTGFDKIRIINNYAGTNEINLIVGTGLYTPPLRLGGTVQTETKSGSGQLYNTPTIDGVTKILDFDADRLFFSIENKTGSVLKLGGVDVLQAYIEIEAGAKYSDSFAPTGAVYLAGTGKVSVASKYKTQQAIITPSNLTANGNVLVANGNVLVSF